MKYSEDDLLALSGIQHFYFCKRQWALIHVERQWEDNQKTVEGHVIHERADDPFICETPGRNDNLTGISPGFIRSGVIWHC